MRSIMQPGDLAVRNDIPDVVGLKIRLANAKTEVRYDKGIYRTRERGIQQNIHEM